MTPHWRNVYVDRDGRLYPSPVEWPSRCIAAKAMGSPREDTGCLRGAYRIKVTPKVVAGAFNSMIFVSAGGSSRFDLRVCRICGAFGGARPNDVEVFETVFG